jgi:hypothetical protein
LPAVLLPGVAAAAAAAAAAALQRPDPGGHLVMCRCLPAAVHRSLQACRQLLLLLLLPLLLPSLLQLQGCLLQTAETAAAQRKQPAD